MSSDTTLAVSEKAGRVFISYSRVDEAFADQLASGLERVGGYDVLIDRIDISYGDRWENRLGEMLRQADSIVFVVSPDSFASEICHWEVAEARRLGKRIIPALWREVDFGQAPEGLGAINAVPFRGAQAVTGLNNLIDALEADLDWLKGMTEIGERAAQWEREGRPAAFLLRGVALNSARDLMTNKPPTAPEPTALQREYLAASEEEEARLLSAERKRIEELEAANTAAVAAKEAEEEARHREGRAAKRVIQRTVAGLVAALLFAGAAGVLGFIAREQERRAEEEAARAESAAEAAEEARDQAELEAERAAVAQAEAERQTLATLSSQSFGLTATALRFSTTRIQAMRPRRFCSRSKACRTRRSIQMANR